MDDALRVSKEEGFIEAAVKIARKLLGLGIPVEKIIESTGLTLKEIEALQMGDV